MGRICPIIVPKYLFSYQALKFQSYKAKIASNYMKNGEQMATKARPLNGLGLYECSV